MISDYDSLQTAVASWLARGDLTDQIPTFIQLAEARMNRDLRSVQMQVSRFGTVTDSNQIVLPSRVRAVQSLRLSTGGTYTEINPLPPARLADGITSTFPIGYVVVNNVLTLIGGSGTPDYKVTYYEEFPSLDVAPNDVNWLLLREPGLYLYATLLEAEPYLKNDKRIVVWAQMYQELVAGMNAESESLRYGNNPAIASPIRNAP